MIRRAKRKEQRVNRNSASRTITAGLLIAVLLLMAAGCSRPAVEADDAVTRMINVEAIQATPQSFQSSIRITGSVQARSDVTLVAEEGGVIVDLPLAKGSRVEPGTILARLEDEMLTAQLQEAEAAWRLAQEQWKRQQRLWEVEQIGTELQYIQARETALMRAATVRLLQARLDKKILRSPIRGVFDDHYYAVGEYVSPGAPLMRVIERDNLKITGGVPERYAGEVVAGTPVELRFDALPGQVMEARIGYVGSAVEPQARTFPVEVALEHPQERLKPGMIASLRIIRRTLPRALVIPQEAVVRTETGYQVFVVDLEQGHRVARARPVVLGPSAANQVVIAEGLSAGEWVVTVGQLKVGNGDRVNLIGEGSASR